MASEEDGDAEKACGKLTPQRSDVEGKDERISYWCVGVQLLKPFFVSLLLLIFKRKQPIALVYK